MEVLEKVVQASRRKYHYIYKTTCIITSRYYFGMHSTDNLEDGYVGSGQRLWHSINKHGRENHVCEILEFLPDRKSLHKREEEIITQDLVKDSMCMNLITGGHGSWHYANSIKTPEERSQLSRLGYANAIAARNKLRESGIVFGCFENSKTRSEMIEKAQSPEAKAKRIESFAKIEHQKGNKNSQHGTMWIQKDGKSVKIKKDDFSSYESDGWIKGRKIK